MLWSMDVSENSDSHVTRPEITGPYLEFIYLFLPILIYIYIYHDGEW